MILRRAPALVAAACLVMISVYGSLAAPQHDSHQPLGVVHFATSCSETAQGHFDRGMRYQHSFWYRESKASFEEALRADPQCAIAYWGIAQSLLANPFNPTPPKNLPEGAAALQKGVELGAKTARERDLIAALSTFYRDYDARDQRARAGTYAAEMQDVARRYPDDDEVQIYYALALNMSASPADKTYANQLEAAAILEPIFKRHPQHPGAAHYLIHTYDSPALAAKGLDAAVRYARIAEAAPHAQHMPSHIFTRVGYWKDSIASNTAAARVAKANNEPDDQLHASDYLIYAYLQLGRDRDALRTMDEMLSVAGYNPERNTGPFALAASPARYAVERGDWSAAAALQLKPSKFPYVDAITHFARALGAIHSGRPDAAKADVDELAKLRDGLRAGKDAYWAEQVDIQFRMASAWLLHAEGHHDAALKAMSETADAEDRTEKATVTPGPLAPARELYGAMLLERGMVREALAAYEQAMAKEPGRFNGLAGGAKAAAMLGEKDKARTYYAKLVELTRGAESGRRQVAEAEKFLGQRLDEGSGSLQVTSPDGALVVAIGTGEQLTYAVRHRGRDLILPSPIGLALGDGTVLGARPIVASSKSWTVDQVLKPVVRVKRAEVRDRFNARRVDFTGGYALIVRAYDDGIAWRFVTNRPGELTVTSEDATFRFAADHQLWFPEEESLLSHQERLYKRVRISEAASPRFCSLPMLVETEGGPKVAITEADLFDYPGMDISGAADHTLKGIFPAYPAKVELKNDRDEAVVERADYIAKTKGTREFPWRVLVVAEHDATLLDTDIVYRLAAETTLPDTSWIRPGKVAWDWWNALNLAGVPFRAGVNTETYKHYIDFAAEHGVEYVILDEGWYTLGDLTAVVPDVDMAAIAAHARARGVGLIMWVVWKTLDQQMDAALDLFERWGVKGIKVDFMQREDQWMVNYYERVAREAAKRRLLVDFHGAYKPTGLYRTWPNVVTSEGVVGLEHDKWSTGASPDNAVTFPFLRMLAGPVDYTPGAMINATKADFKPIFNRPMSQGTRCHQLAMYVVLESPLQMLADSPSNYRKEPESLAFMAGVPTTWDETRVLAASVGEFIAVARRSARTWYIGGLTNWTARDMEVDLSFLEAGAYALDLHRDGPNADRNGVDYTRERRHVSRADRLRIHLAPGGGFAARIEVPR